MDAGVAATVANFPAGVRRRRRRFSHRRPLSGQADLAVELKGELRSSWTLSPSSFRVGAPAVAVAGEVLGAGRAGQRPADQANGASRRGPRAPLVSSPGSI
jgi:hypothetical protein